jgi:Cysteine-rich secretory protein family
MLIRRLLILSLLVSGMLLTPLLGQKPAEAGPRTDTSFVASTNALRAQRGLPKLRVSPTLSKLAYRHSVAMARKDRLWHNDISSATDHWVCSPRTSASAARSPRCRRRSWTPHPPRQHPPPQGEPGRGGHLHQQGQDLGHGQLRADHPRVAALNAGPFDSVATAMAPSARSVVGR